MESHATEITHFFFGQPFRMRMSVCCPLIRVARAEANRLFVRRRKPRLRAPSITLRARFAAMDSFEVTKILAGILWTCLGILGISSTAVASIAPDKMPEPA